MIPTFQGLKLAIKDYLLVYGWSGLYWGFLWLFTQRKRDVRVRHPLLSHPFLLRLKTSDRHICKEVLFDGEYSFNLCPKPSVIIDVGANIGLTSMLFAERFPEALIISIEANRKTFEQLIKNTAPYPNIQPLHAGLWKEAGELVILNPEEPECCHRVGLTTTDQDKGTRIPAVTLSHVLEIHKIDRVDLLKVDVEGTEIEIFEASATWIERVDNVVIELHDFIRPGCTEAVKMATRDFSTWKMIEQNAYISRNNSFSFKPDTDVTGLT